MQTEDEYAYCLELLRADGGLMARAPVVPDWQPACDWARLVALRQDRTGASTLGGSIKVRPVWDAAAGEPYVSSFEVAASGSGGAGQASDIPINYLYRYAQRAGSDLVDRGELEAGDTFLYRVLAFPAGASPAGNSTRPRFDVEEVEPALILKEGSLQQYLERSVAMGHVHGDDFPVVIRKEVVIETAMLMRRAGARETGGVLLGHLRRDPDIPEIFADVIAQVPARLAESSLARLSFTGEAWADIHAAIAERGQGKTILGWWHTHPVRHWRASAERVEQEAAELANRRGDFFSADDCALHRTVFPAAYSVGMVVSDLPTDSGSWQINWSLFGWRRGMIEPRGYYMTHERDEAVATAGKSTGGHNDQTG